MSAAAPTFLGDAPTLRPKRRVLTARDTTTNQDWDRPAKTKPSLEPVTRQGNGTALASRAGHRETAREDPAQQRVSAEAGTRGDLLPIQPYLYCVLVVSSCQDPAR